MNPIFQALGQGYNAQQILKYISQAIPGMAKSIAKATGSGYSSKQILGFLSKNFETEDRTGMSESQRHAANKRSDAERTKYGLTMAATAVAAPIAASVAGNALSRALPVSPLPSGGQSPHTNNPIFPGGNNSNMPTGAQIPISPQQKLPQGISSSLPIPSSPSPPPASGLPNNISQPSQIQQSKGNISSVLNGKPGVQSKIDDLISSGNNHPTAIAGYFKKFHPTEVKRLEKESGSTIEEVISDYLSTKQTSVANDNIETINPGPVNTPIEQENQSVLPQEIAEILENPEELTESEPKIEKNSIVASPIGMGEIKEIRNGKAIIEVDGKKHQVSEDDLISSPLAEKDLADLYDELITGIESKTGQQVSRNVEWAGYDPINNELIYKPHGSKKVYTYEDIPENEVEVLTNFLTQRKSTGQNFIGAWQAGTESPIGAAMYQLIKRLQEQRGGKGKEYRNRFETIYDALEPAKEEARKRHEERKKKAQKPKSP